MDGEREKFERAIIERGFSLTDFSYENGYYKNNTVQAAWIGFQCASLPSAQPSDVVGIAARVRKGAEYLYKALLPFTENQPLRGEINEAYFCVLMAAKDLDTLSTTQQATKDEDAAFQWAWVQKYKGKVRVNREGIKREWFGIGYRSTTQQVQNTAPLNGGTMQRAEPSDSVDERPTPREGLQGSCGSGVQAQSVQKVVDRFLSWPLPNDFNPDGGISYKHVANHRPTGTNLLTETQAEAMVRHILATQESWDEQRAKAEFSSHDDSGDVHKLVEAARKALDKLKIRERGGDMGACLYIIHLLEDCLAPFTANKED